MAYQSVNPANGEILRRFDQHTDEQMQSALATAHHTYQHIWSKILQYYADNAETFLSPKIIESKAGYAHLEYSPIGVSSW